MKYNKQKECEGCLVYPCMMYDTVKGKPVFKLTCIEQCPCRVCIVKSMCKTVCSSLTNYYNQAEKIKEPII